MQLSAKTYHNLRPWLVSGLIYLSLFNGAAFLAGLYIISQMMGAFPGILIFLVLYFLNPTVILWFVTFYFLTKKPASR